MQIQNHQVQYKKVVEAFFPLDSQDIREECPTISLIALQIFAVEYAALQKAWQDQLDIHAEQTKSCEEAKLEKSKFCEQTCLLYSLSPLAEGGGIAITTTASTVPALKLVLWTKVAMTIIGSFAMVGGIVCCAAGCYVQEKTENAHQRQKAANSQAVHAVGKLNQYRHGINILNAAAEFYSDWEKFIASPTETQISGLLQIFDGFSPFSAIFKPAPELLLMHHICRHLDSSHTIVQQWNKLIENSTSSKLIWGQLNIKFWANFQRPHPKREKYCRLFEQTDLDQYANLHKIIEAHAKRTINQMLQ